MKHSTAALNKALKSSKNTRTGEKPLRVASQTEQGWYVSIIVPDGDGGSELARNVWVTDLPAKRSVATASRRPKSDGYVTPGHWYRIIFKNEDVIYFHALTQLKNGNIQGKKYDLFVDRPRAKAKGKQCSTQSRAPEWKEIPLSEVPFKRFAGE